MALSKYQKIGNVYNFVRNNTKFGYNEDDTLPASRIFPWLSRRHVPLRQCHHLDVVAGHLGQVVGELR